MSASPKRTAIESEYVTIREVADRLHWHEDTVRKHVVPAREWKRDSGKVPARRFGERWLVPAWWLREVIADARTPPDDR